MNKIEEVKKLIPDISDETLQKLIKIVRSPGVWAFEKRYVTCLFSVAQENELIFEYSAGATVSALARKYSCSRNTITKILKKYNKEIRNHYNKKLNTLGLVGRKKKNEKV